MRPQSFPPEVRVASDYACGREASSLHGGGILRAREPLERLMVGLPVRSPGSTGNTWASMVMRRLLCTEHSACEPAEGVLAGLSRTEVGLGWEHVGVDGHEASSLHGGGGSALRARVASEARGCKRSPFAV